MGTPLTSLKLLVKLVLAIFGGDDRLCQFEAPRPKRTYKALLSPYLSKSAPMWQSGTSTEEKSNIAERGAAPDPPRIWPRLRHNLHPNPIG